MDSKELISLMEKLEKLTNQFYEELNEEVNFIIQNNIKDENIIIEVLEKLLDICYRSDALILYKKTMSFLL